MCSGDGGRFEQGQFRRQRQHAAVLFVLRTPSAGVVADENDQPGVAAGEVEGHQRVEGDVEAHALDAQKRPHPAHRSAKGDFDGDFFVARPLDFYLVWRALFQDGVDDGRDWRAGVTGHQREAGFDSALGQGAGSGIVDCYVNLTLAKYSAIVFSLLPIEQTHHKSSYSLLNWQYKWQLFPFHHS